MRIILLYRKVKLPVDGIRDYALRLAEELGSRPDVEAHFLEIEAKARSLPRAIVGADVVAVQYLPSSWGRGGLAPWLPWALWRLRLRRGHPLIALFVHERWVASHYLSLRIWQRVQLRLLHAAADVVYATVPAAADELARLRPRRPTLHVPVGSNLPDCSSERASVRTELGISDGALTVALFGMSARRRLMDYVEHALDALVAVGDVVVLNLGQTAPSVHACPGREVRTPGQLPPNEVARLLAASDVALMPWRDGASSCRTTLMAALQNGVPVVTTRGSATDATLLTPGALVLTPLSDPASFAEAAVGLAREPARRRAQAEAGKRLYAQRFDWPVLADSLLADWIKPLKRASDHRLRLQSGV